MTKLLETTLVMEHIEVAKDIFRIRLHSPKISAEARAGQFIMIRIGEGYDPLLRRPFSFHRINRKEGTIDILYRVVGCGTRKLSQIPVGQGLSCIGPLGNCFRLPANADLPVILVAGGIGIAPLYELTETLLADLYRDHRKHVHLFYGARTREELLPESYFDSLGIRVYISTNDGTCGFCGVVTELLSYKVAATGIEPAVVYSCGTLAMQYHVARWAAEQDITAQLSLESLMACGVGACLGCALPALAPGDPSQEGYLHVCQDGPIIDSGLIQWNKIQPINPPTPISLCK